MLIIASLSSVVIAIGGSLVRFVVVITIAYAVIVITKFVVLITKFVVIVIRVSRFGNRFQKCLC
jgi:hypothetical protein